MLWRVFVAGFASMQVMMYAIPTYLAGEGDMPADIERLLHWASLVLTLPAVFYSCGPFFANAWRDLKLRRIGMDVPVALGIGVAFLASLWATVSGQGEVYFDSVSMFAFFLLGGRFLEMLARQRAVRGLEEVARVIPAVTERLESGTWERVPVARLAPGDRIRVRPGQTIPVDGRVGLGHSEVSEAILTGESRPSQGRRGSGASAAVSTAAGCWRSWWSASVRRRGLPPSAGRWSAPRARNRRLPRSPTAMPAVSSSRCWDWP